MNEATQKSRVHYQRTISPDVAPWIGSNGASRTHPTRGRTAGCPTRRVGDTRTRCIDGITELRASRSAPEFELPQALRNEPTLPVGHLPSAEVS